jgi:thiamine-monophosphate kinase
VSLGEFELIGRYFSRHDKGEGVSLGIGDDCALLAVPDGYELAITTDTLNEGIHFFKNSDPYLLGYKTLAVNVSDLAAMGASPYACTLSLTLNEAQPDFLEAFSQGFFDCAKASLKHKSLPLIGGNTTKGELSFTVSAYGLVKKGQAMCRDGARVGDGIYVTGTLGLPALAVEIGYGRFSEYKDDFHKLYAHSMKPASRCDFACRLAAICTCAIDISDGLVGDLRHILLKSKLGAKLELSSIPYPEYFKEHNLDKDKALNLALAGGGDYELLFTLSEDKRKKLAEIVDITQTPVHKIGEITANKQLIFTEHGNIVPQNFTAFEHFYGGNEYLENTF